MNLKIFFIFFYSLTLANGQGLNHQWLMGSEWFYVLDKGRMTFNTNSYTLSTELRKMPFWGTNASICDSAGNLLMSSNGVWIANATGDTMDNGAGLNPGQNVNSWPNGLLNFYANIFLPYPGDKNKYVLFHHTDTNLNGSYTTKELLYSVIDITLDTGLGSVISKNNLAFSDTINEGIAATRHANGRDWWIVMSEFNSSNIYIVLFTPFGIQTITNQHLNYPKAFYTVSQPTFSQQGDRFLTTTYDTITHNSYLVLADFDRCSGLFSNDTAIQLTSGYYLWGQSFSPSGKFAYASGSNILFQINTNTLNVDTVGIYDGYYDLPNAYTTFGMHYLAVNGHIYMTSMGSALRIHEIMAPDSADTLCNFQQHNIFLNFWNFRAVPNHPNYYLGCDTTLGCGCATSFQQLPNHDFRFRVYPNPLLQSKSNLHIGYLLPQYKSGKFYLMDYTCKVIYSQNLPPFTVEQSIKLPMLSSGLYLAVVESGGYKASKKIVIQRE